MKILSLVKCAVGVTTAAAILAACSNGGGSQLAPLAPGVSTTAVHPSLTAQATRHLPGTLVSKVGVSARVIPDRGKSWMNPDAKASQLLYISDSGTNDVYVYSYPKGKLVGTLTGFSEPQGECSDSSGNVWIANTAGSNLLEFAHGGTHPIATLSDPGQFPAGCAVNLKSGDLAATNIISTTGGAGSISLYKGATGTPKIFSDPTFIEMFFDGYDGNTLYSSGFNTSGVPSETSMNPKGKFTDLTFVGATVNFPGSVGFDRGLWIADQSGSGGNSVIYQVTRSGSTLTVTGTTQLLGSGDCVQLTVFKKTAICPDAANFDILFYHYPAGGNPYKIIKGAFSLPIGSTISV
jgi:hypothetical protein